MLLCTEDIERLERKGYRREFFARFDRAGYVRLKNRQCCCVFFDAEKRQCRVYKIRPLGCHLYPVVFDEAKGVVVDEACRAKDGFSEKKKEKKGEKVIKLLEKIDAEAEKRRFA
jgi:Fe-S-cluster containining protein